MLPGVKKSPSKPEHTGREGLDPLHVVGDPSCETVDINGVIWITKKMLQDINAVISGITVVMILSASTMNNYWLVESHCNLD